MKPSIDVIYLSIEKEMERKQQTSPYTVSTPASSKIKCCHFLHTLIMFSKATDTLLREWQTSCTIALHYPAFYIGNVFWDLKLQDSKKTLSLQETVDKCVKNRRTAQGSV